MPFSRDGKKTKSPLEQENDNLNNLAANVMSAAKGTDERKAAIERLQSKYPDFLANLDAEKISNDDIRKSLKQANDEFLKKLQLQSEEAKLQELLNKKTKSGVSLVELQEKAQEKVRKLEFQKRSKIRRRKKLENFGGFF